MRVFRKNGAFIGPVGADRVRLFDQDGMELGDHTCSAAVEYSPSKQRQGANAPGAQTSGLMQTGALLAPFLHACPRDSPVHGQSRLPSCMCKCS